VASREQSSQDFKITQPSSSLTTVGDSARSSVLSKCQHLLAAGFGVAVAISCLLLAISTIAISGIKMLFWGENG
jgi:hypothetical protein